MNIRSLLRAFSLEKPASVKNEEAKVVATPTVSSKGISSFTDSFEASSKAANSILARDNYFSGKQLDAESLQQEQDYAKRDSGGIFDPAKSYTGVVLQQGRVQLDFDFNESESVKLEKGKILIDSDYNSSKDDDD